MASRFGLAKGNEAENVNVNVNVNVNGFSDHFPISVMIEAGSAH
jgi:endonuclease/exonuclease/phosphatase family metal-dependent hydrolase